MRTIRTTDWLISDQGECQARPAVREWDLLRTHYYFHRFLTEVVDLIEQAPNEAEEWDYLPQIRMYVRQLILNSYWLRRQYEEQPPKSGVAIRTLYDEIGYPLTVQNVTFAPGMISPIHNHGAWGVVAVLKGQEKHTFWRRVGQPDFLDPKGDKLHQRIELVGEKILSSGEIMSFTPDAIHQVEAIDSQPTVTFQLYGDTQPRARFEFLLDSQIARRF